MASGKTGGPNEFRSNRGAFDISVKVAPRSKAPGNRDGGPAQGALTQTVIAPGLRPSTPVNVDRLLVTVNAVPAADHARVENGAVVLAASPNAQSNSQSGNGNGPPSDPGTGNGNGPPSDPGTGTGNGPPSDPGTGNGNGPPSDPGAGNGNGPPATRRRQRQWSAG